MKDPMTIQLPSCTEIASK